MKSERLRALAAEMEAEVAGLPAVEDARSDRERSERDQAIRAADARRLVVARAAQAIEKAEGELADRLRWRDALIEASRALEERLLAERAAAASSPPRRSVLHVGSVVEDSLHSLDHYKCRRAGCRWLGRIEEAEVLTDEATSTRHFGCPDCGGQLDAPVLLRTGAAGPWIDSEVVALLPPRPTWPAAPDWIDNERLIERLEHRVAEALERVEVATQGRRRRAA